MANKMYDVDKSVQNKFIRSFNSKDFTREQMQRGNTLIGTEQKTNQTIVKLCKKTSTYEI